MFCALGSSSPRAPVSPRLRQAAQDIADATFPSAESTVFTTNLLFFKCFWIDFRFYNRVELFLQGQAVAANAPRRPEGQGASITARRPRRPESTPKISIFQPPEQNCCTFCFNNKSFDSFLFLFFEAKVAPSPPGAPALPKVQKSKL